LELLLYIITQIDIQVPKSTSKHLYTGVKNNGNPRHLKLVNLALII